MSLKRLKSGLSPSKTTYDSSDFFNLHRYIEAYLKRVLLIGLRLNKVKYEESRKIVGSTYLNTAALIEKALFLLDSSKEKQSIVLRHLKSNHEDFFIISDILIKFSSKYRNRLAHGTIEELKNQELIKLLCHVNESFFKEFESLLEFEYGHSAFDQPRDWGATRGTDENITASASRLKLGKILPEPLSMVTVKNKLNNTAYKV